VSVGGDCGRKPLLDAARQREVVALHLEVATRLAQRRDERGDERGRGREVFAVGCAQRATVLEAVDVQHAPRLAVVAGRERGRRAVQRIHAQRFREPVAFRLVQQQQAGLVAQRLARERCDGGGLQRAAVARHRREQAQCVAHRYVHEQGAAIAAREALQHRLQALLCELLRRAGALRAELAEVDEQAHAREQVLEQPACEESCGSGVSTCGSATMGGVVAASANARRSCPTRNGSPGASRVGAATGCSPTNVPFALPRSSTTQPSPSRRSSAWRRDTVVSSRRTSAISPRPSTTSASNVNVWPASGPDSTVSCAISHHWLLLSREPSFAQNAHGPTACAGGRE
jgi:hypothetical protein